MVSERVAVKPPMSRQTLLALVLVALILLVLGVTLQRHFLSSINAPTYLDELGESLPLLQDAAPRTYLQDHRAASPARETEQADWYKIPRMLRSPLPPWAKPPPEVSPEP